MQVVMEGRWYTFALKSSKLHWTIDHIRVKLTHIRIEINIYIYIYIFIFIYIYKF